MNKYTIPALAGTTMILAVAFAYTLGVNGQNPASQTEARLQNVKASEEWSVSQMSNRNEGSEFNGSESRRSNGNEQGEHSQLDLSNLDLSESEVSLDEMEDMLTVLINDEYKARAEYVALEDEFGEQNPFTNLIKAETNHSNALANLFEAFDLEVPEDNGEDYAIVPESLQEAYEIGVQAEIENIALYEDYLKLDLPVEVEQIFENLMNASEHHLATFEAYASGEPIEGSQNAYGNQSASRGRGQR